MQKPLSNIKEIELIYKCNLDHRYMKQHTSETLRPLRVYL